MEDVFTHLLDQMLTLSESEKVILIDKLDLVNILTSNLRQFANANTCISKENGLMAIEVLKAMLLKDPEDGAGSSMAYDNGEPLDETKVLMEHFQMFH